MSTWNFDRSSGTDDSGANTTAIYYAGNQPLNFADYVGSKRNVVATEKGWVRRIQYTDTHGNARTKDEVLVAANPGDGETFGYAGAPHLGFPDIGLLKLAGNTATGVNSYQNTSPMTVYVTWNEALTPTSNATITASRRDGAYSFTLLSNTTNNDSSTAKFVTFGANNTIEFVGTPGVDPGQYKFESGTITITATATFGGEAANTFITGAVSNSLVSGVGAILANGEFTIV